MPAPLSSTRPEFVATTSGSLYHRPDCLVVADRPPEKAPPPRKVADVMHSGKTFNTVLGEMSYDKQGDVTGYTVGGKKKDRYVLYIWKKGPDGKITYVEAQ